MTYRRYASPVGEYLIVVDEHGAITGIYHAEQDHLPADVGEENPRAAQEAVEQLDEYFAGARREFDVHLAPHGTEFQKSVWAEISRIPFGETSTYGAIAARLGTAARAVGTATGRNPHSIVVPCHRVVGTSGALTGYAGGIDRKVALLRLEGLEIEDGATAATRLN